MIPVHAGAGKSSRNVAGQLNRFLYVMNEGGRKLKKEKNKISKTSHTRSHIPRASAALMPHAILVPAQSMGTNKTRRFICFLYLKIGIYLVFGN